MNRTMTNEEMICFKIDVNAFGLDAARKMWNCDDLVIVRPQVVQVLDDDGIVLTEMELEDYDF